jgi:hypothetical protein
MVKEAQRQRLYRWLSVPQLGPISVAQLLAVVWEAIFARLQRGPYNFGRVVVSGNGVASLYADL